MFRFPWGDMHSLNLGWFLQKFNELREDWATAEAGIDGALDAEIQKAEDALSDVFDARDAAAASATAAAGSASAANTSKTAAQNSATAAASSATLANNKATAAGLSEAAAAQSATQASNSATAAAGSATAAATSASNAGTNATAAATSAANAATSANSAAADAERAEEVAESIPEDFSTLSNDVSLLKTAVTLYKIEDVPVIEDKLNKVTGSNLYDPRKKEIGVINQDGTITYNASYITTGMIPVTPNYKIRSAYRSGETLMYDANINRILLFNETMEIVDYASNVGNYIYNIPNNVHYVKCSFAVSVEPTLMIICEIDPQKPTSYEPYTNYFEATFPFIKTAINPLINNSIAPVLDDMTADTALVANDFRIVNNTLYRITSPVASGGTLTPNTNCTATTITEVLKTLLS